MQLIKALEAARGNGTSMISLIMPPKDQASRASCAACNMPVQWLHFLRPTHSLATIQVSRVQKMLGDEFGTASNIKSRVNRQSVLGAITSAQQRLKLYNKARPSSVPATARADAATNADHGLLWLLRLFCLCPCRCRRTALSCTRGPS